MAGSGGLKYKERYAEVPHSRRREWNRAYHRWNNTSEIIVHASRPSDRDLHQVTGPLNYDIFGHCLE